MDHGWTTGTGPVMCKNAAAMTMVKRSVRDYTFDTFFSRTERRFLFSCLFYSIHIWWKRKDKKDIENKINFGGKEILFIFSFWRKSCHTDIYIILYCFSFTLQHTSKLPGHIRAEQGGLNINILHQGWTRRAKYKHFTSGLNKGG